MSLEIFQKNLPTEPTVLNLDLFYMNQEDPIKMRTLILKLEEELKEISDIQIQLETVHRFSEGLYVREVFIPKNTVLTGKIHLKENINICSQGDITIITEDSVKRVNAPFTVGSRPGIKRVGFAHEDTVWTTVHATNETDLEKIEAELFSEEYSDIETPFVEKETKVTMEGFLCQPQSLQE